MIQSPEQFFGRAKELSRVLSRVGGQRPQSVSIVGERRIGKSSLLFHLTWPEVRKRYLGQDGDLLVVFFDLQQLHDLPPEQFLQLLSDRIGKTTGETGPGATAGGYREFQAVLERLAATGKRLILLFDEFDAITSNPLFRKEFYSFLRSMANNHAVSYVTSSRVELQALCHSAEIADSPFFNIFSNLYLRPFDRSEALDLITIPSEQAGRPLAPYADQIIDIAGYLPFYLQIACSACFDCLEESPGQPLSLPAVETRFLEEATPHFQYLFDHFGEDQIRILMAVGTGNQPRIEDMPTVRRLVRDGYLRETTKDQYALSSRLFANHLRERVASEKTSKSTGQAAGSGSRALRAGDRLEQYEVLAKIDEGGMGYVYQARDSVLGRKVALKIVRPELLGTETLRERFLQEARLAARLSHPAITSVFELIEHEERVVLVMEWLEGKTLKQKIGEEGRIHWKQLARWAGQAAAGLEAAHRHGIIHRDIKSANLFLTTGDQLKILDFGLAKNVAQIQASALPHALSSAGTVVGTVDYMSPEQACAERVDYRTDLFSLGIVCFEALTGALPFHRSSMVASIDAVMNQPAPDLALYEVEGAERIEPILNRLLEKNPARRYQSAALLEKDLNDLLKPRRFGWFR